MILNYPSCIADFRSCSALSQESSSIDFELMNSLITVAAQKLLDRGIGSLTRVAILSQNSIEYAVLTQAIQQIGASAVLLNCRLTPADWSSQIKRAETTLLICDHIHIEHTLHENQCSFEDLLGSKADYVRLRNSPSNCSSAADSRIVQFEVDREAAIIFTSGSSGLSKGVRLSLGNFASSAAASNAITKLGPTDCWLISLPMYHLAGLGALYRTLYAGARAHIISSFSDDSLAQALTSQNITHLSVVPTQLQALISSCAPEILSRLKAIILAGAPSSQRLLAEIKRLKLPVLSAYGMTETTAHCCCMGLDDPIERIASVGKPFANTKIEVVDENGKPVQTENVGEIRFSGPTICLGYLDQQHSLPLDNNWLYSGDMGYFDQDGYLHISGRKDDMFISGGENIHPSEIEKAALLNKDVLRAAVVAIPDERWGMRPILFIEKQTSTEGEIACLPKHLNQHLAKFKVPDKIVYLDKMPLTAIGKSDYGALRKQIDTLLSTSSFC